MSDNGPNSWKTPAAILGIVGAAIALLAIFLPLVFSATGDDQRRTGASSEVTTPTPTPTAPDGEDVNEGPDSGSQANSSPNASQAAKMDLEVLTSEYLRTNLDGTEYRVYPSTGKLDFRYGWVAHTENGDLKTDDCAINSRIIRSDGIVLESSVDNACSLVPGQHGKRDLEPGTYSIEVKLEYPNQPVISKSKQITVLSA